MNISKNTKKRAFSSQICQHMGIPLRLIKQRSPQNFACEKGDPYENYEPYFLVMNANPTDDDDTWATANLQKWDLEVESVFVIRADQKDINPHRVEALVHYCRYQLHPQMIELKSGSEFFLVKEPEAEEMEKANPEHAYEELDIEDERWKFIKENMW